MRRLRLRTGPTALFLALLAISLVVFLPMRLMLGWVGLGDQGFVAREVRGTIWSGALTEARFGEVALGDLSAGVAPLPLLVGRARIALEGREGSDVSTLRGAITAQRNAIGIDGVTASIPTGRAFAPLPIGAIDLSNVRVRFRDGACEAAEGRVVATLGAVASGIAAPQAMSGAIRCEGGAVLVPLTAAAGGEGANVRLWQDGRYRADLTLAPADPTQGAALQQAGFIQEADGWRLSIEGRF